MMCPYTKTVDGFEMHIGVNHLGKAELKMELFAETVIPKCENSLYMCAK